jgi:NADPH2:quinone reductase
MTRPGELPRVRRVVRFEEFGPPSVLAERSEPLPEPGTGEVVVRVAAAGVNFADTMVRRGEYRRDQPLPFVAGMEVAGTVAWAPPGSGLAAGTPVAAFMEDGGGYTDYAVARRDRVFPVPPGVGAVTVAAAFLQGVSAWYAVDRYGHAGPGDHVLVTAAAGGLGGLAVQLAADLGARVIGTASTEAKRAEARKLGCIDALDAGDPGFGRRVRELTGGRGADVVIDGVGGPVFEAALACLANNGRYVVAGSATQQPATVDVRRLMPRAQTISGFIVRRVMEADPAEPGRALSRVLDRVAAGAVTLRTVSMGLGEAARAHELIESRQVTGKICLLP